jgi:hypothetical protein
MKFKVNLLLAMLLTIVFCGQAEATDIFTWKPGVFKIWAGGVTSPQGGTYLGSFYPISTLGQNTNYIFPDPGAASCNVVVSAGSSPPAIIYHSQTTLTVANVTGMYGTPVSVIPAVTGKTIVITDAFMTYTEAGGAYASGGTVQLQYHGGSACTGTVAATAITAASGSTYSVLKPVSVIGLSATGIDITNNTGAFTQSAATGVPVLDLYYRLQ